MTYSSCLTDPEWEIVEPLLLELLPPKKQTRLPDWTKREILDGIFYQQWLQLGRFAQGAASLFHGLLVLQTMARCRSD